VGNASQPLFLLAEAMLHRVPATGDVTMSIIDTSELTDAEMDEVSGGESVGFGIFQSSVAGISFEYNSNTGRTYIVAGGRGLDCNSNGRCQPY
jgi:hypothetical protein